MHEKSDLNLPIQCFLAKALYMKKKKSKRIDGWVLCKAPYGRSYMCQRKPTNREGSELTLGFRSSDHQ